MQTNHMDLWKAKGLPMSHLVMKTGMSAAALYKCLEESRAPRNPLAAAGYAQLLGIQIESTEQAKVVA